ncbi:MAG: hypothetical protein WCO60_19770 [Verrucomicrobiota bacterium]
MNDFHLERLAEPSSWSGIGGLLLTAAHATSGTVSTVFTTMAASAFGVAYFLKEKAAGVAALGKVLADFFQKPPTPPTGVAPATTL